MLAWVSLYLFSLLLSSMEMQCVKELPDTLPTSYVYLSTLQEEVINDRELELLYDCISSLPCWVPHRRIANALGLPHTQIEAAEQRFGRYVWATELENVHSMWRFQEPQLMIHDKKWKSSEKYFNGQKPKPFNKDLWNAWRDDVMRVAVCAKYDASAEVRRVLGATKNHPLVAIKKDSYWGFDADDVDSVNMLPALWVGLREVIQGGGNAALFAGTELPYQQRAQPSACLKRPRDAADDTGPTHLIGGLHGTTICDPNPLAGLGAPDEDAVASP